MIHFKLNTFSFVPLNVGQFFISAETLFANATTRARASAVEKYGLDSQAVVFQMNPLYVDTGRNRVVIDPAAGDKPDRLSATMQAAGIDPATIDTVIITHAHGDHYDGGIDSQGQPAFPNARYYMQRAEWARWLIEDNPEPQFVAPFRKLLMPLRPCFTLLDGDQEIVPGIKAIRTPGHSMGHMSLLIGEDGEGSEDGAHGVQMIVVGDVIVNVVYVEHPDWYGTFDLMPELVVETRRKLLKQIADHGWCVYASHFAEPCTGRVTASGSTWQWTPQTIA